ncbi:MAG: hypothetical protein JWN39_913 [Ilumatobacteraceae bacterium]|nr:hypothetical protein [Ilumatobacteraceae bacterium]
MRRDERFTVGGHAQIEIELAGGSVTMRASESGSVSVQVESSGSSDIDLSQIGDTIAIRQGRRGRSARIAIDAPVGTDLWVRGSSIDVSTHGALGVVRSKTTSGDLQAEDVVRLDVAMSSGDARVGTVRDEAQVATASGDVVIRSVGGRLNVTLASGDLRVDQVGGDVEAGTASGDVTINRFGGSAIAVRTVSGDVRIGLPSGIRVDPQITTMSGSVRLPDGPSPVSSTSGERRQVRLRVRTVSGDIRIERAD